MHVMTKSLLVESSLSSLCVVSPYIPRCPFPPPRCRCAYSVAGAIDPHAANQGQWDQLQANRVNQALQEQNRVAQARQEEVRDQLDALPDPNWEELNGWAGNGFDAGAAVEQLRQ